MGEWSGVVAKKMRQPKGAELLVLLTKLASLTYWF